MVKTIAASESANFEILFQKLDEAKIEVGENFLFSLEQTAESQETIALFKEYQESLVQPSYMTFTKA